MESLQRVLVDISLVIKLPEAVVVTFRAAFVVRVAAAIEIDRADVYTPIQRRRHLATSPIVPYLVIIDRDNGSR